MNVESSARSQEGCGKSIWQPGERWKFMTMPRRRTTQALSVAQCVAQIGGDSLEIDFNA